MKGHVRMTTVMPLDLSIPMHQIEFISDYLWTVEGNRRVALDVPDLSDVPDIPEQTNKLMYYSTVPVNVLQFLISDMKTSNSAPKYKLNINGRNCAWHGTCTLSFTPDTCEMYIFTWISAASSLGSQTFIIHNGKILMNIFCYIENDLIYEYNPYIVSGFDKKLSEIETILEIFLQQRRKAANKIVHAYLEARYNPTFSLCKRVLLREYHQLVDSISTYICY